MFEEIKKNFGFGMMRLPMKDDDVDYEQVNEMVDLFLKEGFNYFDTAHGYISGKSEIAVGKCLAARHNRSEFILTNKLTEPYFHSQEEIRPFFEKQLLTCGVDYFDIYLMHAQNREIFAKFKERKAYETAMELKKEGKIRHLGISFHDKAEVLDQILAEYPEVEIVQIQLNYVDWEDASVESRKVYEVCEKYGKPVLVMEPVKGGNLAVLPPDAQEVFDKLGDASAASYAIRFAASQPCVRVVLSGMSNLAQMQDNISYMKDFEPLNEAEQKAVDEVCAIFKSKEMIPCTACSYCTDGCPMQIRIPDMFACYNKKKTFNDWNQRMYYSDVLTTGGHAKASECLQCGQCEGICPQGLPIITLLQEVAKEFE